MFNTTIHGHDEDFSEDDEGSHCDVLVNKSPLYHSMVKEGCHKDGKVYLCLQTLLCY